MDTAKLERAAQRYRDAATELDDARTQLQAEAVAAIRQEGKRGDQAEVARITGWTREQIRLLVKADREKNAPAAPTEES